ncbi:hypothetical protein BABINDRAFT_163816 [Babjeviella inositovora NRRL Y-12698]|uniref:Protein transport protein SFT2 n=1 Tax=Babjeviella inositovora NRRL Y-12698 TaxID=984486 RepID=A0A1E3QHH3_9ASCO|nr:uncharacterized protein BABINDRAFT_163816 [Babjeviella inositovora NRRL Y-12698]ODQ77080.1 hypothetical protein BABINDRAFT_163816 [Babjeviella inositovora NRRL Y-12698]
MSFFSNIPRFGKPASVALPNDTLPLPATQPSGRFSNWSVPAQFNRIALPVDEEGVEPSAWSIELSHWDRIIIFSITLLGCALCYTACIFLFPALALRPRKFAILWSLGSLLFIISFGVLHTSVVKYLEHLFSPARLWFTVSFTTSIVLTLVSALRLKSSLLSIIFAAIQLVSVFAYAVSYFPGGTRGLQLAGNVAASQVDGWLSA